MRRLRRKKSKLGSLTPFFYCAFITILFISIGFASYSKNLGIDDISAVVRIQKDIRVTDVYSSNPVGGAVSNWEEYNVTSISSSVSLPNSNSSITYQVQVTNFVNMEMALASITGLPSNLQITSSYPMESLICDDNDSTKCTIGAQKTIPITVSYKENGYDSSNTNYIFTLDFYFKQLFHIYYRQVDSTNLRTTALSGETFNIQMNSPYPAMIKVIGHSNYSYNSTTGVLLIDTIANDITVKLVTESYFVSYDGTSQLFNNFTNSTLVGFSRNTSLDLAGVLAKGAVVISTSSDDPYYPSDEVIYGWVENNHLYWWSEADQIYFHPNTTGAFRNCGAIITIDLRGTNTSKVKNFAHWFDQDRVLENIYGKINTSGLYYDTSVTFNFAADTNDNSSSGTGLTYMFNDCKKLMSIDLSEFDTTNAMDMKRMFGGCNAITSLDLSGFDTHNVKSMYWMFRANWQITELNLSMFNTTNVQNMNAMFLNCTKLDTIILGTNFDTGNVVNFARMFESCNKLTTIYVKTEFDFQSCTTSASMFKGDTLLVGGAGGAFETPFDSSHLDSYYALIADTKHGYFTESIYGDLYSITYTLNGGIANNPVLYYSNSPLFTLENPYKLGSHFLGWTGSNGNVPQKNVSIPQGTTGNLHYEANFSQNPTDNFPTVFRVAGQCEFNGASNNISGAGCFNALTNEDYTDRKYINTGVNLYNSENYLKDFEITFDVDEFDLSLQGSDSQHTIMNSKLEKSNLGYPGINARRNGNNYEIKSAGNGYASTTRYTSIRIIRTDGIILYSVSGGDLIVLDRNANYNAPFDLALWFGAAADGSGNPMRYATAKLSNITVKLGDYSE